MAVPGFGDGPWARASDGAFGGRILTVGLYLYGGSVRKQWQLSNAGCSPQAEKNSSQPSGCSASKFCCQPLTHASGRRVGTRARVNTLFLREVVTDSVAAKILSVTINGRRKANVCKDCAHKKLRNCDLLAAVRRRAIFWLTRSPTQSDRLDRAEPSNCR